MIQLEKVLNTSEAHAKAISRLLILIADLRAAFRSLR